jgi:hypothetical protein
MKQQVYCTREHNSFSSYYLEDFFRPHFDLIFDPSKSPNKDQIFLWSVLCDIDDRLLAFLDQGGKCIIDGLWESETRDFASIRPWQDQIMILIGGDTDSIQEFNTISIPQWFWYSESLWYASRGYDQYVPDYTNKTKKFFMPVRRLKPFRDQFFDAVKSELDNAIWSLGDRGRPLPGYPEDHDPSDQRYFNPAWYDQTYFSVVLETSVNDHTPMFLTEKTFKPIAFYHPFMLLGHTGSLSQIRSFGFETFPEIFDESYDDISDVRQRIEKITQEIKKITHIEYTKDIQEKLSHNRNLFFDKTLVADRINQQLMAPLLDFVRSH